MFQQTHFKLIHHVRSCVLLFLALTECVEEATFPCVGGTSDHHMDPAAKPLASPLILQMLLDLCLQITH